MLARYSIINTILEMAKSLFKIIHTCMLVILKENGQNPKTQRQITKNIPIFPPVWNSSFLFHTNKLCDCRDLTIISTFIQNAPFVKPIGKE